PADGSVVGETAVGDAENAAVLVVDGTAHTEAGEGVADRCPGSAPGQVAGERTTDDAGGALVLDRAAGAEASGSAPAVAAEGPIVGERAARDDQRGAGLIEDRAAQGGGSDITDGLIVGEDALGDGEMAAGVVDSGALPIPAFGDRQAVDDHVRSA